MKIKLIYISCLSTLIGIIFFLTFTYQNAIKEQTSLITQAKKLNIYTQNKINLTKESFQKEELTKQILTLYQISTPTNIQKELSFYREKNIALENEIKNLNESITTLTNTKNNLTKEYNELIKKQQEEEQKRLEIEEQNSTFQINNVPTISQFPNYPTGCEITALYILLKYYGINTSLNEIMNQLPQGGYLYTKDNIRYGGNPNLEFVGNPQDPQSFGVYEGPIIQVANNLKNGITNGRGNSLNSLLEIVKQNRPVMVWTTINLLEPYIIASWTYEPTMEKINWYAHEHAVIITGFSNNYIIISDPYSGTIKKQNRALFEARYNTLGKRNIYY